MEYLVSEEEIFNWLFSVSNVLGLQPSKTQEYIQNRFLKSKQPVELLLKKIIIDVLQNTVAQTKRCNPLIEGYKAGRFTTSMYSFDGIADSIITKILPVDVSK